MKRIFQFFAVCVVLINTSKASHLYGGEITWQCQPNGQYIFTLKLYRDCSGIPLSCADGFQLDVSGIPGLCAIPLPNVAGPNCGSTDLSPIGGTPAAPCFTCASNDPRAVEEWRWTSNPVTLNGVPPATGWTFSWNSCCRNPLQNLNGVGFTVRAKMYPYNGQNANPCFDSSPFFTERPNTLITTGFPYTYNPFAVDPEQDSLVYEFGNPLDQPSSTCPNFVAPNIPFTPPYSVNNPFPGNPALDPVTGELSLNNLGTNGNYAACIKVTSYKCGVKVAEIFRDYAITFTAPVPICNPPGSINTPPDVFPPFLSGFDTTVVAGDTIRFTLRGNDFEGTCPAPGAPQSITIESPNDPSANWGTNYSSYTGGCLVPPCAVLTKVPPATGFVTLPNSALITNAVRFVWPTSCSHLNPPFYCPGSNNPTKNYTFILKMRDNVCPVPGINTSTIKITVVAPDTLLPPEIRCAKVTCGTGDVRLEWETPGGAAAKDTHNYFVKYHIFASLTGAVGSFTLIDSLEGGKPIFYNKFKDVSATSLSLLGANVNGQNNSIYFQMKTVCGCDSTVFSKPSNIARSMNMSVVKVGTSVALNWNSVHNPLLPSSSNKYEVWREYPFGTWTKVTDVIGATSYNDSAFVKGLCIDSVVYQIRTSDNLACESWSNCDTLRVAQTITAGITPATPVSLCAGATATLTATPASGGGVTYTYQWSGAGSGVNQTVTASTSGTYTVTVTQQPSGCTATASKVVAVSPAFNASVSGITPKCAGQSTTLTINTGSIGNWQYWIDGPTGQITGIANTNPYNVTINNLQVSHNYTIDSLKDVNGCKATIVGGANIVVNPLPTAAIAVTSNDTICQGNNTTVTFNFSGAAGQAPYTLTYTSPAGNQVLNTSTNPYVLNVSPPPPSFTYGLVSLTDNNGCVAVPAGLTGTRKIVVNPTPSATLSLFQGNDTICFGDSVRLKVDFTGTAPFNITLKDNNTGALTPISTSAASAFAWVKPNAVGNFNYTLQSFTSSTKLCTGPINNNVLIVVKAIPNANLSALTNTTICNGDSINLSTAFTGAANYSFVWKPIGGSNTTTSNISASPYNFWVKPTLTSTGYVLLSVTDAFCSRTAINDTVFVNINPLPTAIISTTTPSICQGTQATLNINFTGTVNFSGSWQLQGGGAPTNFNTASNPYTFNVTPAVGSNVYQLVGQVTDGNGCKQNVNAATATVNVIQLPIASLSGNDTACVGSAIQLNVNFPQGTAPYTFYYHNLTNNTTGTVTNVNPGAGNPYILNITGLATGTYNFQLDSVKSSGCKGNVIGSAIGVINPLPVAALTVASDTICQNGNTNLNINFTTGTGPYTYTLQGQSAVTSAVNPIVINVAPASGLNTYTLVNIQDKNCQATTNQAVTVRVIPNPTATITSTDSICNGDNATITVNFTGQGPFSATYGISTGGSNTIANNASTVYTTQVAPTQTTTYSFTNANVTGLYGCSSVVTNNTTTVVSPKPVAVISGTQSICRNDSATITINFTTGTAPYSGTYLVNGGGAVNFSGITSNPYVFKIKQSTAGTFNYTLLSANDRYCSAGASNISGLAAVTVKQLPTAVLSGATTICDGAQTNLSIAFTGTGNFVGSYGPVGGPFTNYNTASNPLVISVSPSSTTSYQLTGFVTDNTGCQNAVSTTPVAINVTQLPQATLSGLDTACVGGGTQLTVNFTQGSAPYTFYYHNTTTSVAGTPITTSNNPYTLSVASLPVGTYGFALDSVISFGCKGSVQGSGQVVVKPLPVATISVASDTICAGTSTSYTINFSTGTGPYTYQLSGGAVQNTSTPSTTISISPTAPSTNYTLTNITDKFCSATVSNQTVSVKVIPLPDATITSTPSICENLPATVTINFTGIGPFNATYTVKSPSTSLITNNIVAHPSNTYTSSSVLNETTTYTLVGTVSGLYGCSKVVADSHITIVNPRPTSQLLTVDDICVGEQTSLSIAFPVGTPPFNYTLTNNLTGGTTNYTANSSPATINVAPNVTTTYSVTSLTDANNCVATQMTNASTITVHPLPQPVIVGDNAVCDGQSSVLSTAIVTPPYASYVWSQAALTTPTISVNTGGNFTVTVTDVNGCVNTSPVFAFVVNDNPVIDFTNDTSLACEVSNINFTNLSTYEPNATFAWTLAPGVTSNVLNPSYVYTTPGTYQISLTIVNPTGCTSSLTKPVDITFYPLPEAKFMADPLATNIYSSGINFFDQSVNAVSWQWNFGDDNTSTAQNPSHYYGDVGEYMVKLTVTNIAGCVSEYQQEIIVNPFYLPNAFTPNKDGRNDFFYDPGFKLDVASYNMKVFNRWGQKFFETESTTKTWDGSDPSGNKAPQGVYVYSIDVKTKAGKSHQYNGTVTLLR